MSTTLLNELTVTQARRRLSDTSRLSPAQVDELQKVVDRFHALRPRDRACAACGSAIWSEHATAAGDAVWACSGCHRPASLTHEAWHAQLDERAQRAATEAAAIAASEPQPRDVLSAALDRRAEAAATLAKLEQALPAARTALATAQTRHDTAVAAVADAERTAITRLAASMTGDVAPASAMTSGAARGQLRTAEDALSAARGAKALLDDQSEHARRNLANAEEAVRTAALAVLAREAFEDTLANAVVARANYLEAVGGLAWFLRNGAVRNGDARAAQLVAEASETPPGRWREAAAADGGMAQRLAELAMPL